MPALTGFQTQHVAAGSCIGSNAVLVRPARACRSQRRRVAHIAAVAAPEKPAQKYQRPDHAGRYGQFGGKYVPETLIPALAELEVAYKEAMEDPSFQVIIIFEDE